MYLSPQGSIEFHEFGTLWNPFGKRHVLVVRLSMCSSPQSSIELRVDNTVIDQDIDLATIDNAHVDVKITLPDIGEQC